MRRRVPKKSTSRWHEFSGVFQGVSFLGFYMSLPGVEPALSSWKVGVVTALPPSRTINKNILVATLDKVK